MPFHCSLEDLRSVVALLHIPGHWVDEGEFHTFSSDSGEHINFWPASGELTVQGHSERSRELEQQLSEALAGLQA